MHFWELAGLHGGGWRRLVRTRGSRPNIQGSSGQFKKLAQSVAAVEEMIGWQVILDEIKRQNHHISNAAKALELERSHLYKKCQQLGIHLQEMRK
jgi:DNA-binding NtrC family response regulator